LYVFQKIKGGQGGRELKKMGLGEFLWEETYLNFEILPYKWGRRKIKVENKIKVTRGKSKFTSNSPTRLKQLSLFLLNSSLIKYIFFLASIIICKNSQFWQKSNLQFISILISMLLKKCA
jgi:hypothetical protein